MYPILGSLLTGAAGFYVGSNYSQLFQKQKKITKELLQAQPNHSFLKDTIQQYTEVRKQQHKYIIYSKYHKCHLSTHQLITQQSLKSTENKKIVQIQTTSIPSNAQTPEKAKQTIQKSQQFQAFEKKHAFLFQSQLKNYAGQLIGAKTCNSVELIYGPIFSKDTPYKLNSEVVKNVYTSNVKVSLDGQILSDRCFALIVCNRNEGSYLNAFSHRKSPYNTFRFLNCLTSVKKIEEQTGLSFNLSGAQLTLIDYQGINKDRLFDPKATAIKVPQNGQA